MSQIRSPIKNITRLFNKNTSKISYPTKVKIFEVGPRDGLQNEFFILETSFKVDMIKKLVSTGITNIEATSFVSHKAIPQFYDAEIEI